MKKALLIGAGIAIAVLFFVFLRINNFFGAIYTDNKNAPTLEPQKTKFNILLMGYGGGNHAGTYLTDTLMVAHVDIESNRVILISLPRDIWVNLPTYSESEYGSKINTIYQMGLYPDSFPDVNIGNDDNPTHLITSVVGDITGLPIDFYVGIDFAGFVDIIDTLGGIEVTVERAFTDLEYPIEGEEDNLCGREKDFELIEPFLIPDGQSEVASPEARHKLFEEKPELKEYLQQATEEAYLAFPCRYETLRFDAGAQTMDGATALKYARSRHSAEDGGDFARAKRQQKVIEAVKDKLLSIGGATRIFALLDDLEAYVGTNVPPALTRKFVKEAPQANTYQIKNLVLSSNDYLEFSRSYDGQSILVPRAGFDNWGEIRAWIKKAITSNSGDE